MKHSILFIFLIGSYYNIIAQSAAAFNTGLAVVHADSVIINMELPSNASELSVSIDIKPLESIGISEWQQIKKKAKEGNVSWTVPADEPIYIYTGALFNKQTAYWIAEPGDRVALYYDGEHLLFTGKGHEKFDLLNEIELAKARVTKPSNIDQLSVLSLKDYLDWDKYLNEQLDVIIPLIDQYKDKISSFAFNHIKVNAISRIEKDRFNKFWTLYLNAHKFRLTGRDLCEIFDSTFYRQPANWMRNLSDFAPGWYDFVKAEVHRKFSFNENDEHLNSPNRKLLYYEQGKKTYKGLAREKFLIYLIAYETIEEFGFIPETEILLDKYYKEPGYPAYKKWLRTFEIHKRKATLIKGRPAPDFTATDKTGRIIKRSDFNGTVNVLYFCGADSKENKVNLDELNTIYNNFQKERDVSFSTIAFDPENYDLCAQNSRLNNLYSEGHSGNIIRNRYQLSGDPQLVVVNPKGIIVTIIPFTAGENTNARGAIIDLIKHQLALLNDGPYVIHKGDSLLVHSIFNNAHSIKQLKRSGKTIITAKTDMPDEAFHFPLKTVMHVEPAVYPVPPKLFVLSDIEGNFDMLKKLLKSNGIIDDQYNWTFGEGHLVFNGDMFDRGEQVTECLWLIYSLEEKAKAAGGYLHYILGNHEIMNLSGDIRYVNRKYKENAKRLGLEYAALYNEWSEIGRWLRTKNIIEKIGDILFTHGGISKEIADLNLDIEQLNNQARLYYANDTTARKSSLSSVLTIYNYKTALFWYRDYYKHGSKKKPTINQIDSVLNKFNARQIITGHTLISDTVSVHYQGKVINVDTHHAQGKSEALLIEADHYYRVNAIGEKKPLFNFSQFLPKR
ncbi:metallophosphoesterase [Longitalea luteola]|uniref:metallophosphoesterase n=1 Tax=Longitalea luteola TaxID=2812563 RepID=UPI001A95CA2D|nr:metallophosphoesterase [Longitalea luteola]